MPTLVAPGLHWIKLKASNAYVLEVGEALTLVDCGMPGDGKRIVGAIREMGRDASDVNRIIVTHAHADHLGGLAELKEATGAPVWLHPLDAEIVRNGRPLRPGRPAPGLPGLLFPLMRRFFREGGLPPVPLEYELADGQVLDGDIQIIHVPGASAGQVALLWNRTLIAGDAISNVPGFGGHQFGYEDLEEARRSREKLLSLEYDNAVFGHGKPIVGHAAERLREKLRGGVPVRMTG